MALVGWVPKVPKGSVIGSGDGFLDASRPIDRGLLQPPGAGRLGSNAIPLTAEAKIKQGVKAILLMPQKGRSSWEEAE